MRIVLAGIAALSIGACASVPNTYAERLAAQGCYTTTKADQRWMDYSFARGQLVRESYLAVCAPTVITWFGADDSRDQQRSNLANSFPSEEPR
jgi:hypothetical protein